jgi:hypothetical protein
VWLLVGGRALASAAWLLLIMDGVLALVLVLTGISVADESMACIVVTDALLPIGLDSRPWLRWGGRRSRALEARRRWRVGTR